LPPDPGDWPSSEFPAPGAEPRSEPDADGSEGTLVSTVGACAMARPEGAAHIHARITTRTAVRARTPRPLSTVPNAGACSPMLRNNPGSGPTGRASIRPFESFHPRRPQQSLPAYIGDCR